MQLQKTIFRTEKGGINIYDPRINQISLNTNISFKRGKPNCISFSGFNVKKSNLKYIYIRFNSILNEYSYYNKDPIIGLYPYNCSKNNNIDVSSSDLQSKYFIICTASDSFEIGFWNCQNLYCDLLSIFHM